MQKSIQEDNGKEIGIMILPTLTIIHANIISIDLSFNILICFSTLISKHR
jgi:hypothetical protein